MPKKYFCKAILLMHTQDFFRPRTGPTAGGGRCPIPDRQSTSGLRPSSAEAQAQCRPNQKHPDRGVFGYRKYNFYRAVGLQTGSYEGSQSMSLLRCLSIDHWSPCLKSTGCSAWNIFNVLTEGCGKSAGMLLLYDSIKIKRGVPIWLSFGSSFLRMITLL